MWGKLDHNHVHVLINPEARDQIKNVVLRKDMDCLPGELFKGAVLSNELDVESCDVSCTERTEKS